MSSWTGRGRAWLIAQRTSARLALVLRLVVMGLNSILSLVWTPLLLTAMGQFIYGTFLSFHRAIGLAGLGDFGISAGVSLRAGQLIGAGDDEKLDSFVSSARSLILLVALVTGLVTSVLALWLPDLLGFIETSETGSLPLLFAVGGCCVALNFVLVYFAGLNAAYANVTWPIIPGFLLGQFGIIGQYLLLRAGAVLWVQTCASIVTIILHALCLYWMLRISHPWLWRLFPFRWNSTVIRDLLGASGWIYLYSLGHTLFAATDALLINAWFGASTATPYLLNIKPTELAAQVVGAATTIALSKINIWWNSSDEGTRDRAKQSMVRLGIFQSFLGTAAAICYLALNDVFIAFWVGAELRAPAPWQWAFALSLAISMGSDSGVRVAALVHRFGVRVSGLGIFVTALLNLGLSYGAARMGSITGVAVATVLAHSILGIGLSRFSAVCMGLPTLPFLVRSWIAPMITTSFVVVAHSWLGARSGFSIVGLLLIGGAALAIHGWAVGITRELLREEYRIFAGMFGARKQADESQAK